MEKKKQGFAALSADHLERITSMGGRKVSQNREYMKEISRRGGQASGIAKRAKKNQQLENE